MTKTVKLSVQGDIKIQSFRIVRISTGIIWNVVHNILLKGKMFVGKMYWLNNDSRSKQEAHGTHYMH